MNWNILLMASQPAVADSASTGNTGVNPIASFFPFILMFVIFWFLIIRPQRKRQKETENMLGNLQIHDQVITSGGIYGTIVNIKKETDTIILRIDETTNTKIKVQRHSIAGVMKQQENNDEEKS